MLIEQIIEFDFIGSGHPGCTYIPATVIFMTKQKSLRKIMEWIIIYC